MGLRIMCAGCSKEEREQAELAVKRALHHVPASEAWTVSLVKMRAQWSVTLDAPAAEVRSVTVLAPESRLGESITEALRNAQGSRAPAPPATSPTPTPAPATPPPTPRAPAPSPPPYAPPSPSTPRVPASPSTPRAGTPPASRPAPPAARPLAPPPGSTDRLQCEKCGRPFRVVYESQPGEEMEVAPVACPHCWHGNRAMVGAEAAETRDYRAEKLDS
jgi:hypothetical protein